MKLNMYIYTATSFLIMLTSQATTHFEHRNHGSRSELLFPYLTSLLAAKQTSQLILELLLLLWIGLAFLVL